MTSTRIQHHFDEHEDGTVHTLCVNNPQRLNILNSETMQSLRDCLQTISEDDHARVLILRGSGNKAWIGGADIREMAQLEPGSAKAFISQIHQLCEAIRTLPIPVIAAIRGYCLGAGLEVAVSCDLRLAADNSSYGMPEVRVGLPSVVEAALLPKLIGAGRARDLVMTARIIDAEQALHWGLVNDCVTESELDTLVNERVEQILAAAPRAMRAQKSLCNLWEEAPLSEAIETSIELFDNSFSDKEPQLYLQRFLNRPRQ